MPKQDGYLARFQEKLTPKPNIKQYTIKDYRELKNNIEYKEQHDTGKLGFDPTNETYQKKVNITLIYVLEAEYELMSSITHEK